MSTIALDRPGVSDSARRLSPLATVKQELLSLDEVERDAEYIAQHRVIPHGPEARFMDAFWIRELSSIPPPLRKMRPLGSKIGVNIYTPKKERCEDHFHILAGLLTGEVVLQAACGLWRSTPSGAGTIPVVEEITSLKVKDMSHEGHELQSAAWITKLARDAKTGCAQGFTLDRGKVILAVAFKFVIIKETVFDRMRRSSESALTRQEEFVDCILT